MLRKILWVFCGLWCLLLAWIKIVHEADIQPYFIDEVSDTLAAVTFFTSFDYTSIFFKDAQRFGPTISVGLVSTWPSALVWLLGGSLFSSRLVLSLVACVQTQALAYLVLRRFHYSREIAFGVSSFLWLALLQVPYWYGFALNLGETTGFLFLCWGVFFLKDWPRLAFFVWGLAVWHCKFIYVPCVFFLGLAHVLTLNGSISKRIRQSVELASFFFLPLVIWLVVMTFKYSLSDTGIWIARFIDHLGWDGSGLDNRFAGMSLLERLEFSKFEWVHYPLSTKLRILVCFFSWIPVFLYLKFRFNLPRFSFSLNHPLSYKSAIILGGAAGVSFHALWYFLKSPSMYLRHGQPGFLMGVALSVGLVLMCFSVVSQKEKRGRFKIVSNVLLVLFLGAVFKETYSAKQRFPLLSQNESYARNCRKTIHPRESLTRTPCVPKEMQEKLEQAKKRAQHPSFK